MSGSSKLWLSIYWVSKFWLIYFFYSDLYFWILFTAAYGLLCLGTFIDAAQDKLHSGLYCNIFIVLYCGIEWLNEKADKYL